MVSRYGEFVRYRPRFSGMTILLWLAPVVLLLGAIIVVLMVVRSAGGSNRAITREEQEKLKEMFPQESDT